MAEAKQIEKEKPISQSACAKLRGISRQYLNKKIKDGLIPVHDGKKVLYSEVVRILDNLAQPGRDAQRENAERQRQKNQNDEWAGSKYYKNFGTAAKVAVDLTGLSEKERLARIAKEEKQLELLEIELAEKRRELISLEEVMDANDRVAGAMRSALLSLSSKVAPRLEGLKTTKIKRILDDEVNEILLELENLGEGLNA